MQLTRPSGTRRPPNEPLKLPAAGFSCATIRQAARSSMQRGRWTLWFVAGVLASTACSTLPEYAAPRAKMVDAASVDLSDVISYRTLVRGDFKSKEPPQEVARYVERVGAATCAYIITTPDTQVITQPTRSPNGGVTYRVVPSHLEFHAQMDRNCSWWNPKDVRLPETYILEHEQIHFALFELEARRLNDSIDEIAADLHAEAASPEAAIQSFQRQLEEQIQQRLKGILARSREFDEDTSMGHNPMQQTRWWNFVQSELAAVSD